MNFHYPFLLNIILAFHPGASAQTVSGELTQAYDHLLELKVESVSSILDHNYSLDTDQAFKIYILSLRDFLSLSLRYDETYYERYTHLEKEYSTELESIESKNDFISFAKAEIKLHAALIRFRYDDQISGAIRLIQSYNLTKEMIEDTHTPVYFYKTAGVLNILLSVVPERFGFFLNLLGIQADLSKGINQLNKLRETRNLFQFEGNMILALLDAYYLNQPERAASTVDNMEEHWHQSLLFQFLKGLIATKIRDNEQSHQAFSSASSFDADYMKIPSITFYFAESFLKKLQLDSARMQYLKYLKMEHHGEFVKASLYRLYLISLFKNETELSGSYRERVLSEGTRDTEMDHYAYTLVKNNYRPQVEIQKARLLFDGGYFKESLEVLISLNSSQLSAEEKLEYDYRFARACQMQNRLNLAMDYYERMFITPFQEHYLVANAHLQMGYILYQRGEFQPSAEHFKLAMEYKGDYYRSSIRNEARTGLSLIE